jgi:DNA adenine methylase
MRPVFGRIGGKFRLRKKIIDFFPDGYEDLTYIEPFIGGGSLFFYKKPSTTEVIADVDKALINAYKLIYNIDPSTIDRYKGKKTIESLSRIMKEEGGDDLESLTQYIILTTCTYGNSGRGKIYRTYDPYRKLKNIRLYQERLKNTTVLCDDYKQVIKRYDSPNSLIYLDPPYEGSKGLYKNHVIDYKEFAGILENIEGRFILSINDSPTIRTLFKNFKLTQLLVRANSNGGDIGVKDRHELVITNF